MEKTVYSPYMPRAILAPHEYYHIFNRGVNKQTTFFNQYDYTRMILLILYLQSPVVLSHPSTLVKTFLRRGRFQVLDRTLEKILNERTVELVTFALMPNHFHLCVKEFREDGISQYLSRIENAYTKFFNTKYMRSGYLFQGPFQSVHIKSNTQALYLSAYIHRNPREIQRWKNKEHLYPWSSYQDYIKNNRWGKLLKTDMILKQFSSTEEYKNFVETSGAKSEKFLTEDSLFLEKTS